MGTPAFFFGWGEHMAATRLIPLHVGKGKSVAQCLANRTDYAQNPEKTQEGRYISAYACDPETADQEFLLSKRQYEHITGRRQKRDIIAYQIRQSFRPGEVTPEEANEIGYELAMRFTKGKHAFLVSTHVDRAHIHSHIIFNSTTLDCTGKFVDFKRSWRAIAEISDVLCLKHGLSIIEPRPYSQREPRREFPKRQSFRYQIRRSIDAALARHPRSMEEMLRLLERQGYECKWGKHIAVRGAGQQKFVRFRSLGKGYTEEDLEAVLAGKRLHAAQGMSLLIDLQSAVAAGKGAAYQRWAKVFNLKQMAKTLRFLEEHQIEDLQQLSQQTLASMADQQALSASIKEVEGQIHKLTTLRGHIIQYAKTRETYTAYRKAGYSKQFLEKNREAITLHKAAKAAFEEWGGKIPTVKELNAKCAQLQAEKRSLYEQYQAKREEAREFQVAQKVAQVILRQEERRGQEREKQL